MRHPNNFFPATLAVLLAWPVLGMAQVPAGSTPAQPYIWRNVVMGGGGFVPGIVFHPSAKNLMYARTDVGGAYRWDDAGQKWMPLTDWLGEADNNLMGIESIALDPSDPRRVYLAAGTYSGGNAAILSSEDQGKTFHRADVPFKMGGNETGRFNGERLAVDPNDGDILFFGSRHDDLWKSSDRGVTWAKVGSFLDSVTAPSPIALATERPRFRRGPGQQQGVGVVSVVFDSAGGQPGQPTKKIFAALSTTETNLFFSPDAGATWQAVASQPVGFRPNHLVLAPDGILYLSYGKEPGPNTMSDGAIWKFDPEHNVWTNITPLKSPDANNTFGYGAVTVDAQHPATVMVTTFAHWHPHDLIFRSTDSGAHWTQLWQDDTDWDHASAPYTKTHTPHWMGDLEINPLDSDQVLFVTGYGIWSCVNATKADAGQTTRWVFLDSGLEETVPLALISPPDGAHLISGVGDIDGFVHDDLNVSPPQGTFAGPRYGNTEDLAFAGKNPQVIIRAGTVGNQDVRAAISRDGGRIWQELETEPPTGNGAGAIAISADAKTIVWTRGGEPFFTRNFGTNWTACAGLSSGIHVIADSVNPEKFYAFDPSAGKVCSSTNGAAVFTGGAVALAAERNNGYGFGEGTSVAATPGIENDLWLASRAEGLFHSTDGGASFTKLPRVQSASSLGLGKAAPGKNSPALFLAGKIGGRQALFRSDDAGENWVRINDDQHQYGAISHITGDPRVFGRVYFATGGRGVIYGQPGGGPVVGGK